MLAEPTLQQISVKRMPAIKDPEAASLLKQMGKRLRACRIAAGFDEAAEFGVLIGCSDQQYRRYERGEVLPPINVLKRLADILPQTLDFILLGKRN